MIVYHGGTDVIDVPRIITAEIGRDFGPGFYTTDILEQAVKWAKRQARFRKKAKAVLNIYEFDDAAFKILKVKAFEGYTMDWLDMVVACRKDSSFLHEYDLVTGKIADDDVGETVQTVVDGIAPKDFALSKLTFMSANNQICFSTYKALEYLKFISAERMQ